ncbi:MAG: TSUP family transporter [Oscillospiraceae bacterium]|nr:TSUP family transporter [Oscillospiraceae bacterium]
MIELLQLCIVVCPLVFLGAFVDSIAGGGGLITLPAYLMAGLPVHLAAGTNKVVAGTGSLMASLRFFRSGKIRLRIALWAGGGSLIGGFIGAEIAKLLPGSLLQGLMLVALPVIAIFLTVKKDFGQETQTHREITPKKEILISLIIGLAIGLYDGIIGPGTGTFLIMAFTAFLSLDMVTASGCAKVANLASNIASATSYIMGGFVMWQLAIPAILCSMGGAYCGSQYAIRGGGKKIRNMIFVVLGLMFVKMLYELLVK